MKISNIMSEKSVFTNVDAENKRQLLQELASIASTESGIDERIIFDTLLERENLGSTGFGGGTALPHARIKDADKVLAFFIKTNSAVDFDAVDGKPVNLFFLLISPEDSGADHLTALALTSRILKDEEICSKIRKTSDKEEIYSLLVQQ
ncbi:MAG: PTS sugar transporter subunit IIA [Lactobacillus sp.]|jgi:PTS system nitrogen regulatory IIA component|nr:PTS sugar transporter subunit IIA [Lactobacillus sp.]